MDNFSLENARDALNALNSKLGGLQSEVKLLTQQTLNVESLAGRRVPYAYVIPITLTQGSDELGQGSTQVSRAGPFFAERLICTIRINELEDGGDASWVGRYLPISSRWVYPWIWRPAAAAAVQSEFPPLDFEFRWYSDSSDRVRSDKYIPGEVLGKFDGDGIMPVSDIFAAGSSITFEMSPHRAVGNNAPWSDSDGVENFIFTAIFWGYKIVQPAQV